MSSLQNLNVKRLIGGRRNFPGSFSSGLKFRSGAVLLALLLAFQGSARAEDDTLGIALDKTLPGKFGYRTCDIFARALYRNLTKAGGEAYYIVYNWKSMDQGWLCHAIVVYRDAKGHYLGMDQSRMMPVLLPGKTPGEWIQWFNGPGEVELVKTSTVKKLFGKYADLSSSSGTKLERAQVGSAPKESGKLLLPPKSR